MEKKDQLKKVLGKFEVFSIASGAMISSGLFILPAVVYALTGPSLILAYAIAAILVIPAMFSKTELATAMPKSGGTYFFIHRSFGALFGTFAGLSAWFSLSLKSAFALVGMGIFLEPIIPFYSPEMVKFIAVFFTIFFTVLNIISVKESGKFQTIMVIALISLLIFYIFAGVAHIDVHRYVPFTPFGWHTVFMVVGMIFISYGGLTKVAAVAEEVKNPGKTIPLGMFSAFIVVSLLYIAVIFVTVGILDKAEFQKTLLPISLGASKFGGKAAYMLLSGAALMAFVTTANAGILSASRNPMAMAKDNLLPSIFSRVSLKYQTPHVSIIITSLFMIAVIIFLDIKNLVKVASTMKLILFMSVNISVIMMRESKILSYKPKFRSPGYPYFQIIGTIFYLFLIFQMGKIALLITLGFLISSIIWYLLYSKRRNIKESALINVVERVTSKEIHSKKLTDELKEILLERDNIIEDRFDKIIKEATIVDIEEEIDSKGLFEIISKFYGKKFEMPAEKIFDLLQKRETDTTTAIHPGLAIPHIIVDGESKFDIVVARAKKGIHFGENTVHIIFSLAGTRNERTFHLQALMAIAQIIQNKDFINTWVKVNTEEDLRNLILLAERVRKAEI